MTPRRFSSRAEQRDDPHSQIEAVQDHRQKQDKAQEGKPDLRQDHFHGQTPPPEDGPAPGAPAGRRAAARSGPFRMRRQAKISSASEQEGVDDEINQPGRRPPWPAGSGVAAVRGAQQAVDDPGLAAHLPDDPARLHGHVSPRGWRPSRRRAAISAGLGAPASASPGARPTGSRASGRTAGSRCPP